MLLSYKDRSLFKFLYLKLTELETLSVYHLGYIMQTHFLSFIRQGWYRSLHLVLGKGILIRCYNIMWCLYETVSNGILQYMFVQGTKLSWFLNNYDNCFRCPNF